MSRKKPQGSQMWGGQNKSERNDQESGEPLQLDNDKKQQGAQQQGGQHQGGQSGGGMPRTK